MGLLLLSTPFSPDPLYEMTPAQAQQIILERWNSEWGASTPWRLDNEAWNPTDAAVVAEGSPWASLTINSVSTPRQHTLGARGSRKFERRLILFVELHAPSNVGRTQVTNLVHTVLSVFEGWALGGLYAREVAETVSGNDGREYVVVVECTFAYYERK